MFLEGKRGLIVGIANKRSLAWGIAESVSREGARLAVTFQGERLEKNVRKLAEDLTDPLILPCDVTKDEEMDALAVAIREGMGGLDFMVHAVAFALREDLTDPLILPCDVTKDEEMDALAVAIREGMGGLDFMVHAVAFALREELDGEFVATSREGHRIALDISAYSLTALSQRAVPLMDNGGSIVTLSYLGGERVVPNYNVMGVAKAALEMSVRYLANDLGPKGIRVNAISAGPIKTLASSGVHGISKMLEHHRSHAPLRKNTEQAEVGDTAAFLVSDLGRGVTGEVIHVDGGYHVLGTVLPSQ